MTQMDRIGAEVSQPDRVSPDGDSLAYVVQQSGQQYLMTLAVTSGRTRRLLQLQRGDQFVSAPAWSNDGGRLAIVAHEARVGRVGHVMVLTPTTTTRPSQGSLSHTLDICLCGDYAPGLAWSADDRRIAVTGTGPGSGAAGGAIHFGPPGETTWRKLVGGSFRGGLAWQPDVTG